MTLSHLNHRNCALPPQVRVPATYFRQFFLFAALLLAVTGASTFVAVPVFAQTLNTPLGGFAKNNKEPIDIEADQLEIRQKQNIAIFSGKVNVKQGKFTLQSARLVVKYQSTGKAGEGKREISKLDATGGVIVTSDTQSATGDWASMDMKKNTIVMGDNVVISQGSNVIRGSKVLVDLNTGYSRIISGNKTGGRVKAIFKPKKK